MLVINHIQGHMNLPIERDTRLGDIQLAFNVAFPFLRIQFLDPTRVKGKEQGRLRLLDKNMKLRDLPWRRALDSISVEGSMTVAELEKQFLKDFGMQVQLFRKSGDLWIETSLTNHWTLDKQNSEAAIFSQEVKESLTAHLNYEEDLTGRD